MIFDNEQIEVSQYGYKALKSIIWSSRLHELIKTKRKSISKLSRECNLIKLVGDPESLRQRRKYAFLPRGKKMEVDLLKKFIFKNDNLMLLESGSREFLLRILEHHAWSSGRSADGTGKGVEMVNVGDTDDIFPRVGILDEAVENGWVKVVKSKRKTEYFFTKKGLKLPRIKYAMGLPIVHVPFKATQHEN